MRSTIDRDLPRGNVRSLKHILGYLKPYKLSLIGVFIALIITSGAVLSMGAGVKHLVDEGFSQGNGELLDRALLVLLGIVVVLSLATYARFYLITKVGEQAVADIRKDIYNHLIGLSPSFFETRKSGEVMSRMTTDTTVLQVVIGSSLSVALRNILLLFGGITLLIMTSPKLAGYIAIMIPLIVSPILVLGKKVRALSNQSQKKVAELSSNVEETLSGIKTVQAYCRENIEHNNFSARVGDAFNAAVERVKMRSLLTAIVILFTFGSVGIIMWLGGKDVIAGNLSGGELSSFIFYSLIVAGAFGAISEVIGDLQRAAGSAEGIIELLNAESDIKDPKSPVSLPKNAKGRISFKNVTFRYPARQETKAISGVSFDVDEGETIAIVGPSGAGKSTIFQLLLRFYDTDSGTIKVAGEDIKKLSLRELRGLFAYVSQEPVIFSTTALENISYGKSDATNDEIMEAAKAARAYDFIRNLPQGFDTFLGEKGVRISGGERQRIAIARAVLRNPKILLLDEATSSLDAENEKLVQEAIDKLKVGRTTLIIAHRLSTVQKADRIIVINDGQVEEIGKHKELVKKSELYSRLAKLQFAA